MYVLAGLAGLFYGIIMLCIGLAKLAFRLVFYVIVLALVARCVFGGF